MEPCKRVKRGVCLEEGDIYTKEQRGVWLEKVGVNYDNKRFPEGMRYPGVAEYTRLFGLYPKKSMPSGSEKNENKKK